MRALARYPQDIHRLPVCLANNVFAVCFFGRPVTGRGHRKVSAAIRIRVSAWTEALYQLLHRNFECPTNPQHGRCRNRTARFDLLPVSSRITLTDHVLLRPASLLAQFLDTLP